jgi:hypothetical protein
MSAVIATIASAIMIVWLMPGTISGSAMGNSTFHSRWRAVVRGRLHDVEGRGDERIDAFRACCPDTEDQPDEGGKGDRDDDDRQSLHRIGPQAEDREIEGAQTTEHRQPEAADPVPENRHSGDDRDPRQGRPPIGEHAAIEKSLDQRQRQRQEPGNEPGQVLQGEQSEARFLTEPGEKIGNPLAGRNDPFGGPAREPGRELRQADRNENDEPGSNQQPVAPECRRRPGLRNVQRYRHARSRG